MKKSKRFAALFAAVLMAITMFTGSILLMQKVPNLKQSNAVLTKQLAH